MGSTVVGNLVVSVPDNIPESRRAYGNLTNTPIAGGQIAEATSSRFVLVDRYTREIIAELVDIVTPAGSGLRMYHQDVETPWSQLSWTRGPAVSHSLRLSGPDNLSSLFIQSSGVVGRIDLTSLGTFTGLTIIGGASESVTLKTPSRSLVLNESGPTDLTATLLNLLGADLRMDNQRVLLAKDPGGTYQNVLHARWSDDATYLTGGAGGMHLRTNNAALDNIILATSGDIVQLNGNSSVNGTLSILGTNVGPYWPSYGGGWQMTDSTWIRSYGSKSIYSGTGWFDTDGGVSINTGGGHSGTWALYCNGAGTMNWLGGGGAGGFGSTGGSGGVLVNDAGTNKNHINWDGTNLRFYTDATNTKTFVIDHPEREGSYLVHACAEGPTSDVFYRGKGELVDGLAEIVLPDYFESLTELEGRTIQVTPIVSPTTLHGGKPEGDWQADGTANFGVSANLAVSEIEDGRFYVIMASGMQNLTQRFYWRVDAVRKNTAFNVEPTKRSVTVHGDGPYSYTVPA